MPSTKRVRFEAELFEGHKGVTAVLVPFNPEELWKQQPVRLAGRRHGWVVKGTVNRARFAGYIGDRWGRFFVALDAKARGSAVVGDLLALALEPDASEESYRLAVEQSNSTTEPGRARLDVEAPMFPVS